jgi:PAS domain S-box-containing protein
MDAASRSSSWFRSARSSGVPLLALIVLLGVGGYLLTSTTIRRDRDDAAARRARVEAVHAQEVLGRARAYVDGLAAVLAQEPEPGQARFARWAGATSASVGLNDVLWVERVPASERGRYERLRGVPITRLTASGRVVRAPAARSYLPATYTSGNRPELRPGVDVTGFPALAAAIRDRARIFAVGASRAGTLGREPGFYLLEAATFAHGRGSRGYLVTFIPRGWFSTTLGGDPRRFAISEDGQRIEGQLDSVQARAGFEMLGRHWRVDVSREPLSGLQSILPWLALAWPFAVAAIVFAIGRAITLRRRAEREVERIFELSLDMISVAGLDGHFKAVNPAFERTLGYTPEEMLSRPFLDFVHPDDRQATREVFADILGGHEVNEFENRYICADGSERWLQWSARAVPEQRVVYATARDVTERRRIDAELRDAQRTAEARGAELQMRAEEQAALRRVATLVAEGAAPTAVFELVAAEMEGLLDADGVALIRYEPCDEVVLIAHRGSNARRVPPGTRVRQEDESVSAIVRRTERPGRMENYKGTHGAIAQLVHTLGVRASVGAPIVVDGRLWGVIVATWNGEELPPADTEERMTQFAGVLDTAIANAEARAEVERLAEEQAALRRVATLVAERASRAAVFDAVAGEMEALLDADQVALNRFEPGDEILVLAHRGLDVARTPVGSRVTIEGESVTAKVRRTGRPARMENYDGAQGALAELARATGLRSSVSAPIVVEGRLWGLITASWKREQSPPPETEQRMSQFAQLLETAIANAEARAELMASRARLVAASDEARRRVERDLHDGVQQRLVSLSLELRGAEAMAPPDNEELAEQLTQVGKGLTEALDDLRELSRGIHPAILSEGGLIPALKALARRSAVPVQLDLAIAERLAERVEIGAYYVVSEALTNAAKHARASIVDVHARAFDGVLELKIDDDGVGGADPSRGSGLTGLADRVEALGGTISITSPPGEGTSLHVELSLEGQ